MFHYDFLMIELIIFFASYVSSLILSLFTNDMFHVMGYQINWRFFPNPLMAIICLVPFLILSVINAFFYVYLKYW